MAKHLVNPTFWKDKKVLLTGHTGFKGTWLTMWLVSMGAKVWGYSLQPMTNPNLYGLLNIKDVINGEWINDIRDFEKVASAVNDVKPDIVFHLAAQPLVRESYKNPIETYSVNVMGTVNLLEAVKSCNSIKAVINVTTDKCYDNKEWVWGYREDEPLGGYDPYSSSKACSELVTSAYRNSFFNPNNYAQHGVAVASARAGNVIGGGDWAPDRLIPDSMRALINNEPVIIRNPNSIRPWQHVLEPLGGYLLLAEKLVEDGPKYAEAWNFGPSDNDAKPVKWIVESLCSMWGRNSSYIVQDDGQNLHEATYLKLDCSKASNILGWNPKWSLDKTLGKIIDWNKVHMKDDKELFQFTLQQIKEYNEVF